MKKGILAAFVVALALTLTAEIFAQTNDTGNMETKERIYGSVFPRGEKLPEMFAKYFTGQAYLARLTHDQALNCPVSNVTFEPGCRNNWHSHTGGQLLVAVSGRGYYQAKGEPARELLPGDVVEIGPGVVHWHGAAPDSWFSHLAVETNPQTNRNTWLEPVDDAQYAAATAPAAAVVPQLGAEALRNRAELFSGDASGLGATDPELIEIFDNFAFGEVAGYGDLDTPTRMMCILASCIAAQGQSEFRTMLAGALNAGVTPVEAKEVLYQAVPYVGMAKVAPHAGYLFARYLHVRHLPHYPPAYRGARGGQGRFHHPVQTREYRDPHAAPRKTPGIRQYDRSARLPNILVECLPYPYRPVTRMYFASEVW